MPAHKTRQRSDIALAALGNVESQLRSHFNVDMYNGLTEPQLIEIASIVNQKMEQRKEMRPMKCYKLHWVKNQYP